MAAISLCVVSTAALACPPPPPPPPTWEEQAHTFWNRVDAICLLQLDGAALQPSESPQGVLSTLAEGRWKVSVTPLEAWKGDCRPRVIHFADIPTSLCGGGMPPLDTRLLAGITPEGWMTVWAPADGELATALRAMIHLKRP